MKPTAGVRTTVQRERSTLPDLSIIGVLQLQMFSVRYVMSGETHDGLFFRDNAGNIYKDPDGESFVHQLRPVSDKLSKVLQAVLPSNEAPGKPADLPEADAVDVLEKGA